MPITIRQPYREPASAIAASLPEALRGLGMTRSYRRGEEIYREEAVSDQWYRLANGLARTCVIQTNGRRRIVDFLLPGDFFGFTTASRHSFSVEAVTEGTTITAYSRRAVEQLADRSPFVARELRAAAFRAIARLQARILIVGGTTVREKVSSFLVEMSDRASREASESFVLPMSRYDIADYLAVSVETLSRALTSLKETGAIAFEGCRQVRIVDRRLLSMRRPPVLQ